MRQLLLFITAAALLSLAAVGFADTKTVTSPRLNKKDFKLDIKSASAGHAGRRLKHEVVLWGKVPDRFHGQVCADVGSRRATRGPQTPDYGAFAICIVNKRQTRVPVIQMQTGKTKGHARVRYPGSRTVRFIFTKRAIGSPHSYFWRADTMFSSSKKSGDCPKQAHGSYSCFDSAPDPFHAKKHTL